MFSLAILTGIYSYLIFSLGILGLLYKPVVASITLIFIFIFILRYKNNLIGNFKISLSSKASGKATRLRKLFNYINKNKLQSLLILLLALQLTVNLIGVLGPETSFDALWYHLTLPKLYILGHSIFHIPGNLLYYSDMPKLTEMLYIAPLLFGNETGAKFIHFIFGILTLMVIYKLSKKYLSKNLSLLAVLIFYSNLVVGWESITAYIDLTRTFFEVLALWGFVIWAEKKQKKWLVISGIMLGLAATTKLVAYSSLLIFFVLFVYNSYLEKNNLRILIKNFTLFCFSSILVSLPWLTFSFVNTGNLFYPYFSNVAVDSGSTLVFPNISYILKDLYTFFMNLNDPISPVYLIIVPLIIVNFKNYSQRAKGLLIYSFMAVTVWYLLLENRGGRFILPYLPAFSILAAFAISKLRNVKLKEFLILIIIIISFTSIGYRMLANSKYLPVIIGKETKSEYLATHLNFSFGDFYDTDGYFKSHLKTTDTVLLYGFHNLYYVNFNLIDSSWVKKGDSFNYIAVQNGSLPERFSFWREVYYNQTTKVKLYSQGGQEWVY